MDSDLAYAYYPGDEDHNEEHQDEDYRGQGFETWYEEVIAAKESAAVSFPSSAFADLVPIGPSSNGYDPCTRNDGMDTDYKYLGGEDLYL